ncbi:ionotropic receptor 93a-like [Palaemon carinicauda]|uniref:ionotropic receptor 93a-like n=1 Tax=Palaemon carinicauda TaxID=392227 RepID=UPI0035B582E3
MLHLILLALLAFFSTNLSDSESPEYRTSLDRDTPYAKLSDNTNKNVNGYHLWDDKKVYLQTSRLGNIYTAIPPESKNTSMGLPQLALLRSGKSSELSGDESLAGLVKAIIKSSLKDCDLIIAVDGSFVESGVLEILVEVPVLKQVVFIKSPEDLAQQVEWKSARCQGTFLLLSDAEHLIKFGDDYRFQWAYNAKVVIIGLSMDSLKMFSKTMKGQKTEHIIGVVKDENQRNFKIYMNLLFWGEGFKQVSNWRGKSFATKAELFPDKISNLHKGVLKVFMFEFEPDMFIVRDSSGRILGRHGRDVAVVYALSEVFNFTILFVDIPQDWGALLPNGSFTGLVGLFSRDEGHLGIANLFPSALDDRHKHQDYSTAVHEDRGCFIARVEPPLPRWQNPSLPFQATTWLALFIGLVCSGPLLYIIAIGNGENESEDPHFKSLVTSSLYAFAIHADHPLETMPRCLSTRVFIVSLLVYILVFSTGYRANLTSFLTVTRQPKSIETVKDIYEAGWKVAGTSWFYSALKHSENPYLRGLLDRYKINGEFYELKEEILAGGSTMISSSNSLKVLSSLTTTKRGKPLLRLLKECLSSFPVTIGFPVNSPLKFRFDKSLSRMFESGLVERWFIQGKDKYLKMKQRQGEISEYEDEGWNSTTDGVIPLGMDHMKGIFIIYSVGFILSKLSFLGEIFIKRCRKRSVSK